MDSKIFKSGSHSANLFQSIFLLAVRLYWGFLFFHSGFEKFMNMAEVIPFFQELGLSTTVVYLVSLGELVAGFLLFFGLFSRLAALCTTIIMIGAYTIAHPESIQGIISSPFYFITNPTFSFLMASLVILFFGAGLISIDAIIKCRKIKKQGGGGCCGSGKCGTGGCGGGDCKKSGDDFEAGNDEDNNHQKM